MLMLHILTYDVKDVIKEKNNSFGRWFNEIIETTGLKKKRIADKADINPVSLSRILSGEHGIAKPTAIALIEAINELAGREIADMETGLRLVAGIGEKDSRPELSDIDDEFAALFYDSAHWSEEYRNEALDMAKTIFKRYQEKEKEKQKKME